MSSYARYPDDFRIRKLDCVSLQERKISLPLFNRIDLKKYTNKRNGIFGNVKRECRARTDRRVLFRTSYNSIPRSWRTY